MKAFHKYLTDHIRGTTIWNFEERKILIDEIEEMMADNRALKSHKTRTAATIKGLQAELRGEFECGTCSEMVDEVVRRVCDSCFEKERGR